MRDASSTLIMLTTLMYHVTEAKIMRSNEDIIFTDSVGNAMSHDIRPLSNIVAKSISSFLLISKREEPKFINSTTNISVILFSTCSSISSLTEGSQLSFHRCLIYSSTGDSLINNKGGYLSLHEVKLLHSRSCSLVTCLSGQLIEVIDCSFKDIMTVGANFIMNGNATGEFLRDCLFENITVFGEEKGSMTERCEVSGSVMADVERGIYGGIVSGGNEFEMRNSSLLRNFREGNDGTCSTSVTSNCSTAESIQLYLSTSYSFTDCTFTGCSSSRGGALYLSPSHGVHSQIAPAQLMVVRSVVYIQQSSMRLHPISLLVLAMSVQVLSTLSSSPLIVLCQQISSAIVPVIGMQVDYYKVFLM